MIKCDNCDKDTRFGIEFCIGSWKLQFCIMCADEFDDELAKHGVEGLKELSGMVQYGEK